MDDGLTWGTLAAGLIGGAGGGAVATLLRIGYERGENFRSRLVAAADDFSTALAAALLEMNEAHGYLERGAISSAAEPLKLARKSMDQAHTYLARVELYLVTTRRQATQPVTQSSTYGKRATSSPMRILQTT
jgi:hypothetical protein